MGGKIIFKILICREILFLVKIVNFAPTPTRYTYVYMLSNLNKIIAKYSRIDHMPG